MIDRLLGIIAPHHCHGCGKSGSLLCDNCKYDIISEPYEHCLGCGAPTGVSGVCRGCHLPYSRAWCVGERRAVLETLINSYKFARTRAVHQALGDLLLATLPELPGHTIIVPIPTIATHIRQRGYDHSFLIARYVANKRNLKVEQCLLRATNTIQRGARSSVRATQAKDAFKVSGDISPDVPYLIIDDVITTGATVTYAARQLKAAGTREVWVAAIARNPLD